MKTNSGIGINDCHMNFPYTLNLLFFPYVKKKKALSLNHHIKVQRENELWFITIMLIHN